MKHINRLTIIILIFAAFLLQACGGGGQIPVTGGKAVPSKLEPIDGTDLSRVILTEKAAQRIGVQTVPVKGRVVPYSAVIYDTEGNTWIYTNPAPLTFVRVPVVINFIQDDQAYLSQGLESDAPIVTIGVAEIYGAETGVSK
ncbi:MAG TPA: hypothetical protein VLE49_19460 [Anaerolineales bacterium]|nr:hypothetical protein [Anaerolineales bacterium]